MPEKLLLKRASIISICFFVVSAVNPTGLIFGDSQFATQASSFLSAEDIEYNALAQLVSTDEGFLIKNMPQQEESVTVERIDFIEHKVQKDETFETIAKLYNLNPETLINENQIINVDSITIGDILRIPPTDGISHIVKTGETLFGLALKYEVDSNKIALYNNLDKGLRSNSKIFIPGGKRLSTQLIADNTADPDDTKPATTPTKVAHIQTDINANIMPANRPAQPDLVPTPNIAPLEGIRSTRSIIRDADPSIVETTLERAETVIPDTPAPKSSGIWGKPTIGNVSQGFRRGHYAVDIANRSRPPVWATASGTVETSGWGGAYGNYVIIDHDNGYKTLYAHNSDLFVKVGDSVVKGQVIANMGNTGRVYGATGIHLHYECHHNGIRINPYTCME